MIVDVNAYIGVWPYWPIDGTSADDLVRAMDREGIDVALICSLRGLFVDWRAGNAEVLDAVRRHHDRLVAVAVMGPYGFHPDDARACADEGFKAVRIFPSLHNYPMHHPFVDALGAAAAEARLPVILSLRPLMNWRFPSPDIDAVGAVVARNRGTTFVISGINRTLEFEATLRIMRDNSNAFCEIATMQGFQATAALAKEVGSDRVLFGTAAPLQYPACSIAKVRHARMNDDDKANVFSLNAQRLLSLSRGRNG